jgi:RNA polymerase sigma-70 factor (ECF subfamily)
MIQSPGKRSGHRHATRHSESRWAAAGPFNHDYLDALKDRDPDAEGHLITNFYRPVEVRLRNRLRSPELVQDACQETFLRVLSYFRSGRTLNNPASLPGFVHSVCNNISLEFLRAHTRHPQLDLSVTEPTDPGIGPEGQMATEERRKLVADVLARMVFKDRLLLRRVFLDEEDKDAICQEFQVDRAYLRVLVHRASIRFRNVASRLRSAHEPAMTASPDW